MTTQWNQDQHRAWQEAPETDGVPYTLDYPGDREAADIEWLAQRMERLVASYQEERAARQFEPSAFWVGWLESSLSGAAETARQVDGRAKARAREWAADSTAELNQAAEERLGAA